MTDSTTTSRYVYFEKTLRRFLTNSTLPLSLIASGINRGVLVQAFRTELSAPGASINLHFVESDKVPGWYGMGATIVKDSKRSFILSDYLKYKELSGVEVLGFNANDIPFEQGVDRGLSFLFTIFEGPLRTVLLGQQWEDVPFDWSDYK